MPAIEGVEVHPTAVIDPSARIGRGTRVGPHAVIGEGVVLGEDCEVGPGVHMVKWVEAGARNRFHSGAVIGDAPQDLRHDGSASSVRIGDGNIFREHVTVHRGARAGGVTVLGDGNFLMAGSHVAHDCVLGSHAILANGALLAGHVQVGDRAFISGNCLVHQFCRVGRLALMQGGSAISKDLPPFCIARGDNGVCGLNVVGMRRAGIEPATRLVLRKAYLLLFRSGLGLAEAADTLASGFADEPAVLEWVAFIRSGKRGLCRDTRRATEADAHDEG
jgi:UDP-N-acetylglucosamine acyltransferase